MKTAHRNRPNSRAAARGFSLVEIMVAVVVICVGLLGIAKMQALAVSSTTIARQRSLAAFQAASLASAMNSNRTYWASAAAAAASPITITSATATITPAAVVAGATTTICIGGNSAVPACPGIAGAQTLAGFDLMRWSATVAAMLPNAVTTINCPGAIQPPSCIIQMTWTEQAGMLNNAQQINAGQFETPTYTLYVEP